MAGSFAAALLDELMGRNRDANPNDKKRDLHWSDPQICKFFICGICPHDLFTNTRSDLGACTRLHDESTKRDYEKSSRCEKMGYEEDLMKFLTTVILEADKRIQRGHERLEMAAREATITPTPEQADIDAKIEAIKDRISELVAEAEQLGNDGNVDEAKEKTTMCDQLRVERLQLQELRDKISKPFDDVYKRRPMEVCDICGAMLFVDDAPQRLDDHIMGKQHMGYARIRTYMTEYQKKRESANSSRRVQRDSKSKEREKFLTDTKTDSGVAAHAEDEACTVERDRSKSHDKHIEKHDRSSIDRQKTDKESRAPDTTDSVKEDKDWRHGEDNRRREKSDERRRGDESRRHDRGDKSESRDVRERNGRRHDSDRGREHRNSRESDRKHRDRSRDRRKSSDRTSTRDRSRSRSRYGSRKSSERSSSRGHNHRSDRNHDSRR